MRLALHQVLGYFLVTSILNYFAYGIGDEGSSHINTHSHQNSLSRLSGNKRQREEGDDIIGVIASPEEDLAKIKTNRNGK